jgi:hypothetical protein
MSSAIVRLDGWMTYLLLTGVGFTRNWGGWLAKDLLGRLRSDPELRHRVQESDGFESALEALQRQADSGDTNTQPLYVALQKAVAASFRAMNVALANRGFEFSNDVKFSVSAHTNPSAFKADWVDQKRPVLGSVTDDSGCQPISKLHGSTEWQDGSGDCSSSAEPRWPTLNASRSSLPTSLTWREDSGCPMRA